VWLLKKAVFLKKVENRVIENVQETGKNRLQSFLTRSDFCEFVKSEFFNSHSLFSTPIRGQLFGKRVSQTCRGKNSFRCFFYFEIPAA
jgi:hypothetical protein